MRPSTCLIEDPVATEEPSLPPSVGSTVPDPVVSLEDARKFQDEILPQVSRTFALTIPQLPEALREVVANAYLLCRIADTIEDEVSLSVDEKNHFHQLFIDAIAGKSSANQFARELGPLLSDTTIPAEHSLVAETHKVLRFTHDLHPKQREVLARCVRIMCRGMGNYQRSVGLGGLKALRDLDHYCYFVAGVVGEMLTELFCHYLGGSAKRRAALMQLATSFGLGLQMTNILKDVWEDRARGVCWWPQDVFAEQGIDLSQLEKNRANGSFSKALANLIGVAHGHLLNALHYTQLIPRQEDGIRRFCLWAIGLAVLTLQNIYEHPEYRSGQDVKVSRRMVARVITAVRIGVRSNFLLSAMFRWAGKGLPLIRVDQSALPSAWSAPD